MLAATITAIGKIKFSQRFGRLELVIKVPVAVLPSPVLTGNGLTLLNNMDVEFNRVSQAGNVPLIQKIPLGLLCLVATANEGLMKMYTAGGFTYIKCSIEVSPSGSLSVLDNDYYELNITGAFPATSSIDVYAMDFDTLTKAHNIIEAVSVDANAPRELNVSNCRHLVFPKSNLVRLEFLMGDGTRTTYDPAELDAICRDGVEVVAIDEGKVISMDDFPFLIFNVAAALTVRFTYSAITLVRKVSTVDIQS